MGEMVGELTKSGYISSSYSNLGHPANSPIPEALSPEIPVSPEPDFLRYSDTELRDGIIKNNPELAENGTETEFDCQDPDLQPWRGLLRKTNSKININE